MEIYGRQQGDFWSSLLCDVLRSIADKIEFIEDYVSFCAVCRRWYTLGTDFYYEKKKSDFKTPFHMSGIHPHPRPVKIVHPDPRRYLHYYYPKNPKPSLNLTFSNYASKRNFVLHLPEAEGRRCWGSQFGWLVTYGDVDNQFNLLNPFSRVTIPLPSMSTLWTRFTYNPPWHWIKAFLTADPVHSPRDCLVLLLLSMSAAHEEKLVFARPGRDNAWTHVRNVDRADLNDILLFQGRLYGVTSGCGPNVTLLSIQLQPSHQVVELVHTMLIPGDPSLGLAGRDLDIDYEFPGTESQEFRRNMKYLVELDGELCVVLRYIVGTYTDYFKIFRVDLSTGKLTRVLSLGDRCLFLGNNNTFTCKATFPLLESFEQLDHPPHNLTSDLVFYTYSDGWLQYLDLYDLEQPIYHDEGVWEMKRSNNVYKSTGTLTKYPPLWITPSISFRKLEQLGGLRRCKRNKLLSK